jgi:hypothetical protein
MAVFLTRRLRKTGCDLYMLSAVRIGCVEASNGGKPSSRRALDWAINEARAGAGQKEGSDSRILTRRLPFRGLEGFEHLRNPRPII